jgi:hypothetical protein
VKCLVASLCNHTSEVWYVLGRHSMVGFKVLLSFYATGWVKGETSAECTSIMIAVPTVTSGLDHF